MQAEVAGYIGAHADQLDGQGHRLVVRNGYHEPVLVAQDRQRLIRAAEVGPPGCEEGPGRDLQRPGQGSRPERREGVREGPRRECPKAVAKNIDDLDVLLAFYDYPADRWIHLRNTNRLSRPSPPCGFGSGSPRAQVREPRA